MNHFGDTHPGDRVELGDQAGPKSPVLREWADKLTGILADLARLEAGLVVIRESMAELEAAGMYPGVPTESWETRTNTTHGEARYLRMLFSIGVLPNGKRKLYVGADPARQRTAKLKASRRLRWERLEAERVRLERFLRMTRSSIGGVAGSVRRYRIPEELGIETGPLPAAGVPKVEDLPLCTCGMGDGSMPELHAPDCAIVRATSEWVRPAAGLSGTWRGRNESG